MDLWIWSLLLLAGGVGIVCIEVFVPSGGVLGIMATLCFIGAIVVAFMESVRTGFIMVGLTTLVVPAVIAAAIHWWPHTPIGRRILIQPPEHPDDVLPDVAEFRELKSLVGRRGLSTTKMLPGGTVRIDHQTYEAISLGMPIDAQMPVEVVEVRMNRLVVRPWETADAGTTDLRATDLRATDLRATDLRATAASPMKTADDILSRPIDSLGIEDPLA